MGHTLVTAPDPTHRRFRFGDFVLSPRQRLLYRNDQTVALIPKYFDLLHLLVVRRRDAVSKEAIFAHVWSDVVVSDGALSQAIRTLRRTLGDDSREPRFIRTVSRHGYQFAWADVHEEVDDGRVPSAGDRSDDAGGAAERLGPLVDQLISAATAEGPTSAAARDAAEALHALDTDRAVEQIVGQRHHAPALAVMREARWDVPGSGAVPLIRGPEGLAVVLALVRLRLVNAGSVVARRWAGAATAGAIGGAVAGACGGLALTMSPVSSARPGSSLALGTIGAVAGGLGAAGIGAGLASAEVLARSHRGLALVGCGAAAGGLVAGAARLLLDALLSGLFGLALPALPGALEGVALGAAAGAGYALTTRQPAGGGLAAPTGWRRLGSALTVGLCCAATAAGLARTDSLLVGGLVHEIARRSQDASLVLAPLGRLIGEPGFGPVTRTLLAALEGGLFGTALCWGLTRRPTP